jgi:hypothetical protein
MSSKKEHDNPAAVAARIVNFLTGVASKLTGANPLDVLGVDYTAGQLTGKLQSIQAPYTAADEAHRASTKAVQVRDAAEPDALQFLDALVHAVINRFGETSPDLEAFGIQPRKKRRTLTPEQKLARAQKARATRAKHKESAGPDSPPRAPQTK